jgi:hypothetical protein
MSFLYPDYLFKIDYPIIYLIMSYFLSINHIVDIYTILITGYVVELY